MADNLDTINQGTNAESNVQSFNQGGDENNLPTSAIFDLFSVDEDDLVYHDIFNAHSYNYFERFLNSDVFLVFGQIWETEYFDNEDIGESAEVMKNMLKFYDALVTVPVISFISTNLELDLADEILDAFLEQLPREYPHDQHEERVRLAENLVARFPEYLRMGNYEAEVEQFLYHRPIEHNTVPIEIPDMSSITTSILEIKSGIKTIKPEISSSMRNPAWEIHDTYAKLDKGKYINTLIRILEDLAHENEIDFEDLIQNHVFDSRVPFHASERRIISRDSDIKIMTYSYLHFFLERYLNSNRNKNVDEEYWRQMLNNVFDEIVFNECVYGETFKIIAFLTLMIVSLCDETVNEEYIKDFIDSSMSGFLKYKDEVTGLLRTSQEIKRLKREGLVKSCPKGMKERIIYSLVNTSQALYGTTGNPEYQFLRPVCLMFGHIVSLDTSFETPATQIIQQINAMDNPTFLQYIQEWVSIERAEDLNEPRARNSLRDHIFRLLVPNREQLSEQDEENIKSEISTKVNRLVPDVRNIMGGTRQRNKSKISIKSTNPKKNLKKNKVTRKHKRKLKLKRSRKSKITKKRKVVRLSKKSKK